MKIPLSLKYLSFLAILFMASISLPQTALGQTFTVNQNNDPVPNGCTESGCSLREAILAANAATGEDTVILPDGVFLLGIAGRGEDGGQTGDLDILGNLLIQGTGRATISANHLDRVFDLPPGSQLRLANVTVTAGLLNAATDVGAGIRVQQSTSLTLEDVVVSHNTTASNGGGIHSRGKVSVTRSTFWGNTADNGGAIYAGGGSVLLGNSTLTQNNAEEKGGAILSADTTVLLTNVTVSGNAAGDAGGNIYVGFGRSVSLLNSIVANPGKGGNCTGISRASVNSLGNNLFFGGNCTGNQVAVDIKNQDPMLDKLDHYGGATPTLALLAGSPAINAGNRDACTQQGIGNVDQRNIIRRGCDIGAFQFHPLVAHGSPLGTNLGEIASYSTQRPFLDVFKESGRWFPLCAFGVNCNDPRDPISQVASADLASRLDGDGWVMSLPAQGNNVGYIGAQTQILNDRIAHGDRAGDFVVLYGGEGLITYGGRGSRDNALSSPGRDVIHVSAPDANNPDSNQVTLQIRSTDPNRTGNYIRNIRVVRLSDENTYRTEIFNPTFIAKLKGFKVLRFMDWMRTNHNPPGDWSGRAKTSNATYASNGGVPLELMVELANRMQAAPWFNMPHTASDGYITEFATITRDRLNSDLPVYIEYSNETWNGDFPQARWIRQRTTEPPLNAPVANTADPEAGASANSAASYQGMRTVNMCRLWRTVWKGQEDRVICVNAAQANPAGGGTAERVLSCALWGERPCDSGNGVDAIAVAPYFGGYIGAGTSLQTVLGWAANPDSAVGFAALFAEIFQGNGIENGGALQRARLWMSQNKSVADQHGVSLIAYEGGQHLVRPGVMATTSLFTGANRDARMGDAYAQYLNDWKAAGGCLFMHYTLVQDPYSIFGSWGSLEFIDQAHSPKFDALTGFIGANPLPWNDCAPF